MLRFSCLAFAALVVLLSTSVAQAETAVMQPLAEAPAPSVALREAHAAVQSLLSTAGFQLISQEEARAKLLAAAEKPCMEMDCAGSMLRALGADMLVGVAVGEQNGSPVDVIVQLVDVDGRFVNATANLESAEVTDAASAALNQALSKWPVRNLVALRVDGSPAGATVLLDGQPKGTLPLEARVQPGEHVITVSMQGYETQEHEAVATTTPGETVTLTVNLKSQAESWWRTRAHLLGGSALIVGGLASLLVGALPLSERGCQEYGPQGSCTEEKVIDPVPFALWTGAGIAALAGGVTWIVLGERRARNTRSARLDVGIAPAGLLMKGQF